MLYTNYMHWLALLIVFSGLSLGSAFAPEAFAQEVIDVGNATTPCFLNYTAGVDMWSNCGASDDYVAFTIAPFEWVTGGWFSMIIVTVLIIMVYIKYHTVLYPIVIGIAMLPTSYFLFPEVFLSYAIIMALVGIAAGIYWALVERTRST